MNVDEEFDEFKENRRWTWASELEDGDQPLVSRGKFLGFFICDIYHCATREWPTCSDMALIGSLKS